ncbi:hypothetical protein [Cereibacter changlensis]|uniref:hypothetical protein n=1 Tax=Cereibacter changlensis TaxID=402884 RepID=UPI004034AF2D
MQTDKTKPGAADASGSQSRPGLADQAKDAARREMDDARERLHGAADKARGEASRAGRSVQSLMMDEIDKRKGMFCEGLEGVAHAMRKAADDLDKNDDAPAAPRMVHQAVNTIEDMADRLKGQSAEDIGRNLSRYGRENPALFVAGALLAGLAAGRFFVASGSGKRGSRDWDEDEELIERPPVMARGPKGHTPGDTASYGSGRHEDLPSGTGSGAGMATGAGQGLNPAPSYGQGASQSGVKPAGGTPVSPASTGPASTGAASTTPVSTPSGATPSKPGFTPSGAKDGTS